MFQSRWARSFSVLLMLSSPLLAAEAPSASWPTFRGSQRTAVAPDTGLLQEWPQDGPPLLWQVKGAGRGYASLAIAGNRVYTLGDGPSTQEGSSDEFLSCFEVGSEKPVWQTKTGSAWNGGQPNWQGSRSTPSVDGDRVYVVTPHGELVCCDSATGAERWRKDLKKDFGGKKADGWGYSESVLLDGDQLVCTPGGTKNTMIALNKNTGETIWSTVREEDRGAGHASIAIAMIGDTKVYVQTTGSGALGVRAGDGKLLWSYGIDQTTAVIPTPIVRGDLVFFTAGYKRGGALLRQIPSADGEIKVEAVYPITPVLANKHGGVVVVGDYIFGDSDDAGIPFCADLMTGEIKWKNRSKGGKGSASIAAADGRIYFHFANGTMVLAKAEATEYQEVGSFKVPGSGDRPSWAHPVIVDGKLFLREDDQILCYNLRVGAAQ